MPDLAEAEPQALLDGSARLALRTEPRFDRYIFIERSQERCAQLELLKQEFPDLAQDIQIRHGDANTEIEDLCAKDWNSHRAVLCLDPYGMQDWTTIEAIARTRAIDLWVLFPLGIGVNRLLTKSGAIPESWRRRLNLLLGTWKHYSHIRIDAKRQALDGLDNLRRGGDGANSNGKPANDAEIETIVEVTDDLTSQSRHSLLLSGSPPSGKLLIPLKRRDVRVVEGARLESVCRGNSTEGSNPSLSAN